MRRGQGELLTTFLALAIWVLAGPLLAQPEVTFQDDALVEPAPPTLDDYRVGISDLLSIEVFGVEELKRQARVLRDGTVSLPLIGAVEIAGLQLDEAEGRIADALRDRQLVKEPHVTIFVEEYRSRGISVQGAVQRPGVYQLLGPQTLLGILGQAGGLSGRDGERPGGEIHVLRIDPSGEPVKLTIPSEALFDHGDPSLNVPLRAGDAVVVPFAQKLRIYVSGAVESPGKVEYLSSEGITVLQAISAAGGPSERAQLSRVTIKRRAQDGTEEQIRLNLRRIRKGRDPDVLLEANDTVIVGDWFF